MGDWDTRDAADGRPVAALPADVWEGGLPGVSFRGVSFRADHRRWAESRQVDHLRQVSPVGLVCLPSPALREAGLRWEA